MLFETWSSVGRVVLGCVLGYVATLVLVRVSGKRSLAKMNAFDFVINVALGSLLATLVLSDRVPIVNGVAAVAVLLTLQFLVAWATLRSPLIHSLVKADPALLFFRGEFQHAIMRRERITEDEMRSAVRRQGVAGMERVEAIVLETSGDVAVVLRDETSTTAMQDVRVARERPSADRRQPATMFDQS